MSRRGSSRTSAPQSASSPPLHAAGQSSATRQHRPPSPATGCRCLSPRSPTRRRRGSTTATRCFCRSPSSSASRSPPEARVHPMSKLQTPRRWNAAQQRRSPEFRHHDGAAELPHRRSDLAGQRGQRRRLLGPALARNGGRQTAHDLRPVDRAHGRVVHLGVDRLLRDHAKERRCRTRRRRRCRSPRRTGWCSDSQRSRHTSRPSRHRSLLLRVQMRDQLSHALLRQAVSGTS